jgi:hypothetical protein
MCFQRARVLVAGQRGRPPCRTQTHHAAGGVLNGACCQCPLVHRIMGACCMHGPCCVFCLQRQAAYATCCGLAMPWAWLWLGAAPPIASQAMPLSPDTSTVTSGLDYGCYATTYRHADMLMLQQCQGSIDAQTCGDMRCGWRAHACVEAGKQRRSECRPST